MDWSLPFGIIGSFCTIASFVPQAWKILQTRDTKALSTPMYVLTVAGFACWTSYGVIQKTWPLIVTNGICLVLSAAILILKMRSRR